MNREFTPTLIAYSRILRGWAALTCASAFATVLVGTLVTTFHVGMADPLWPTAPWHLLLIEKVPNFGFYVEHAHRIVGYLVGTCILGLTLGLWWNVPCPRKRWGAFAAVVLIAAGTAFGMRLVLADARSIAALFNAGFGVAVAGAMLLLAIAFADVSSGATGRWQRTFVALAFLGVIVQGMLGGLRVYLNELLGPELAVIHGIFAQAVFALTALLALMTTRRWNSLEELNAGRLMRQLTAATFGLILVQVVFGGLLRHFDRWPLAQRLHPMLAFGVLFAATWTAAQNSPLRRKAVALLATVLVQAALGVEAWMRTTSRYQPVSLSDAIARSAHVLVGFGLFASAAMLAARAWKPKLI